MAKKDKRKSQSKPESGGLYLHEAELALINYLTKMPDGDEVLRKAGITRHRLKVMMYDDEIYQCVEKRQDKIESAPWRLEPTDSTTAQILNDHYSNSPETQEFVKIIENNSNDLLRLVTDVLALSELDQYDKLPTNITTDVNAICELAYEVAKNKSQKGVEVFFKPERESLFILSNQERISQVLNNLMHNAAKFTSHGSICIAYSISEAEKKIEISVTDTGIGIPADKQNCVFERFYKVNSFTQGTGLGLSISRSIAEKLGGSLQIDSSYTDGCRIVLTLPLVYA